MKKEPNKKAIGLFLVIGFALFLGLIGQTILHKMHANKRGLVMMHFDESIQGLSEGSPIIFQGVELGKVTHIELTTDINNLKADVTVYARLDSIGLVDGSSRWDSHRDKETVMKKFIEQGLRARLATQSYLTGQLMIEFVILPDTPIRLFNSPRHKDIPQIPTVLSKKEELARGLNSLQIQQTLESINHVAEVLGEQLPILLPALTHSSQNLDETLVKVSRSTDETLSNMNTALGDVSDAAKSVQNLTDYLERHPESIIKGKKGE